MAVTRRALARASSEFSSELFSRSLSFINSRVITVVAAGCSVLYLSFWALALLQNRGIIQTKLPIPVSDTAIIERSHLELVPEQVSQADIAQRTQLIAEGQTGPSSVALSPLTLDIEATAPVQLHVSNPSGQVTGLDPLSGVSVLGIPNALYSGQATNPQLISVRHAMGSYRVQLIGSGTGSYTLTVRLMMDGDVDHALQYVGTGRVFQDTILQATVTVGLTGQNPELTVSNVDALTVALPNPSSDLWASSTQPEAVVRLRPPETLAVPLPLPGVVLPPSAPTFPLPDGAASASVSSPSSPQGSNLTTTTVTWDLPSAPIDTGPPSSSGPVDASGSSGSDTASSPALPVTTVPTAFPTADPPATSPTSAATPVSSSAPVGSTSSASPVPVQAGGSQATPVATPTSDPTAIATPSPTGSGSQAQTSPTATSTADPTADPTPTGTPGSGHTGTGSGTSSGSGSGSASGSSSGSGSGHTGTSSGTGSGSGTAGPSSGSGGSGSSSAGGSNSGNGSSHSGSAPGHSGDPGHSGSAPGHTGSAPGLSGSAPGKSK